MKAERGSLIQQLIGRKVTIIIRKNMKKSVKN